MLRHQKCFSAVTKFSSNKPVDTPYIHKFKPSVFAKSSDAAAFLEYFLKKNDVSPLKCRLVQHKDKFLSHRVEISLPLRLLHAEKLKKIPCVPAMMITKQGKELQVRHEGCMFKEDASSTDFLVETKALLVEGIFHLLKVDMFCEDKEIMLLKQAIKKGEAVTKTFQLPISKFDWKATPVYPITLSKDEMREAASEFYTTERLLFSPKYLKEEVVAHKFLFYFFETKNLKMFSMQEHFVKSSLIFYNVITASIPLEHMRKGGLASMDRFCGFKWAIQNECVDLSLKGPATEHRKNAKMFAYWMFANVIFHAGKFELFSLPAGLLKEIVTSANRNLPLTFKIPMYFNEGKSTIPSVDFTNDGRDNFDADYKRLTEDSFYTMSIRFEESLDFTPLPKLSNTLGIVEDSSRPTGTKFQFDTLNKVLPKPSAKNLPVTLKYNEIVEAINDNQIVLISAATGTGKSTQVPQFILDSLRDNKNKPSILVTQPRRIAAISLASQVAKERGYRLGQLGCPVGYSVRFEKVDPDGSREGKIIFATAGYVEQQLIADKYLENVSHLIIDEVHQRSISNDVLLMGAKRILAERKDFKLVIMSATLNEQELQNYFQEYSIKAVSVEGKRFPVQEHYLEDVKRLTKSIKLKSNLTFDEEEIQYDLIVKLIKKVFSDASKSLLIFLPGLSEMVQMKKCLEWEFGPIHNAPYDLFILHSSVERESYERVFYPSAKRKIILATNIAESSITIPDVEHIIDSGLQRSVIYQSDKRMSRFHTDIIAKSNQIQRRGRIGRCAPGNYYLMLDKNCKMDEDVTPEIMTSCLEQTLLHLEKLRFHDDLRLVTKSLLSCPADNSIENSLTELKRISALDAREDMTVIGKVIADLPLSVNLAKALIMAYLMPHYVFSSTSRRLVDYIAFYCAMSSCGFDQMFKGQLKDGEKQGILAKSSRFHHSDHLTLITAGIEFEAADMQARNSFVASNSFNYSWWHKVLTVKHALMKQLEKLNCPSVVTRTIPHDLFNNFFLLLMTRAYYPNVGLITKPYKKNPCIQSILVKNIEIGDISVVRLVAKRQLMANRGVVFDEVIKNGPTRTSIVSLTNPLNILLSCESIKEADVIIADSLMRFKMTPEQLKIIQDVKESMDRWLLSKCLFDKRADSFWLFMEKLYSSAEFSSTGWDTEDCSE